MQVLFRDVQKRVEIGSPREGVIHFDRLSEAVLYLRRHRHRTSVIATLRQVLFEHHHILVSRMTDDEIINEVSRRLLNGSLQLLEMFEPRIEAPCTVIEEPQEEAAVEMAPPPSLPPLLPLLEALQIEGAEVLPEHPHARYEFYRCPCGRFTPETKTVGHCEEKMGKIPERDRVCYPVFW